MAITNKNIREVITCLREAEAAFPDPSVTLVGKKWRDPYLVLISCLLSLRTKDETTLPATERLFAVAATPAAMIKLSAARIEKLIYPVGFYRTKARTILSISQTLLDQFNGQVPDDLEVLLTFKGVGRKTANLVLTEGFGKPAICVDTHVHRISNRFGYVHTKTPEETEWALRKKLPQEYWIEYNSLLVVWGQNVCRPVSPRCSTCAVGMHCVRRGVTVSR
jgi:endonuclease III